MTSCCVSGRDEDDTGDVQGSVARSLAHQGTLSRSPLMRHPRKFFPKLPRLRLSLSRDARPGHVSRSHGRNIVTACTEAHKPLKRLPGGGGQLVRDRGKNEQCAVRTTGCVVEGTADCAEIRGDFHKGLRCQSLNGAIGFVQVFLRQPWSRRGTSGGASHCYLRTETYLGTR